MTASEQKLRAKIEQFRSKKEVIKAQYSAAEAQVRISEAATGVGEEMADVGLAMQRALDKTENMKARADAVQELEAAGTFEDLTALGPGEDDIDRQLKQLSSTTEVDAELEKMKAEIGSGSPAPRASSARDRRSSSRSPPQGRRAVIVRIATEGQYEMRPRRRGRRSNELDNQAVVACADDDEQQFHDAFARLLEFVREQRPPVPDDELERLGPDPATARHLARGGQGGVHRRGSDPGLVPSAGRRRWALLHRR